MPFASCALHLVLCLVSLPSCRPFRQSINQTVIASSAHSLLSKLHRPESAPLEIERADNEPCLRPATHCAWTIHCLRYATPVTLGIPTKCIRNPYPKGKRPELLRSLALLHLAVPDQKLGLPRITSPSPCTVTKHSSRNRVFGGWAAGDFLFLALCDCSTCQRRALFLRPFEATLQLQKLQTEARSGEPGMSRGQIEGGDTCGEGIKNVR